MSIDTSFSLEGKVVVVTGGASGIGAAIASMVAQKGAVVAVLDMARAPAEQVAEELGEHAVPFVVDVTNPDSVDGAISAVTKHFGRIDVLFHSAGIVALDPAESVTTQDWYRQIDVNLSGTFFVNQAAGKVMLKMGRGKIINMASQAGSIALHHHAAYCASKWGVIGLSKVLPARTGRTFDRSSRRQLSRAFC